MFRLIDIQQEGFKQHPYLKILRGFFRPSNWRATQNEIILGKNPIGSSSQCIELVGRPHSKNITIKNNNTQELVRDSDRNKKYNIRVGPLPTSSARSFPSLL